MRNFKLLLIEYTIEKGSKPAIIEKIILPETLGFMSIK